MLDILLVEDSKAHALVIKQVINAKMNFSVIHAESLAKTRELFEQGKNDFFVSLLDLNLEDAPFGEVVDFVMSKGIPSIILTGTYDENIRKKMWEKGVVDYVIKENIQSIAYIAGVIERIYRNKSISVLVVDDSSSSRKYISWLLSIHQYRVFQAENGVQAMKILADNPEIKLIVTDYNMPEMDGFELTRNIRKKFGKEELAIIGISGTESSTLSAQFIKNGANDYLNKPFINEEFYCRVTQNITMIEDINLITKSEKNLREANATKDKFFSIIAHDLRNPIGSFNNSLALLAEEGDMLSEDEQKELLNLMYSSSKNLYSLLENLLNWSRSQTDRIDITIKPFDLADVTASIESLMSMMAQNKRITLNIDVPAGTIVNADQNMITTVLRNLVSNALKFTSEGGTVSVVSSEYNENKIQISVIDTGIGLSEEDLQKLFRIDVHYTSIGTMKEKGTGLGLILCKEFIEKNGGIIHVVSEQGKGSDFHFTLPKAD